jgi:thiol-disulfide isomerase/thioredoxin
MVSKHISRFLAVLLGPCFAVFLFSAAQTLNPDFAGEMEAGTQAVENHDYPNAIQHFTRANELKQGKCSECYVWVARLYLAAGKLPEALAHAENGVGTATTDLERAKAQLYVGTVLAKQGDLARAEEAFRAASAGNPQCLECKFNLGYVLLKESKDAEGVALFKAIAPQFAGTPREREVQRFIEDPSRVRKKYAPEFSAKTRSGEEINLNKLKGKVVLLDFWGTWCEPCRISLPKIKELAASLDPSKVAIISVDEGDSREKWDQFVQTNGMSWIQVYDGDLSMYRAFNVDGFPRYYVLSKDGVILVEFKGWAPVGEATISKAIDRALQLQATPAAREQ